MKQAIAGVVPASSEEATVMTVWPSNGAYGIGRLLGSLYAINAGFYIFRVGNLIALLSAPLALVVYFFKALPVIAMRYRVTNRRIIVQRGWAATEEKSIDLDRFDAIDVVVLPGQEWYSAGDLVFRDGTIERFRLEGVSRPEAFRQVCLKSRAAYVGVKKALQMQPLSA